MPPFVWVFDDSHQPHHHRIIPPTVDPRQTWLPSGTVQKQQPDASDDLGGLQLSDDKTVLSFFTSPWEPVTSLSWLFDDAAATTSATHTSAKPAFAQGACAPSRAAHAPAPCDTAYGDSASTEARSESTLRPCEYSNGAKGGSREEFKASRKRTRESEEHTQKLLLQGLRLQAVNTRALAEQLETMVRSLEQLIEQ
ncbi:unnamed protein product [Zymoseptoria tritici ST99CH_3D1]|nr:unnamed protein product [Zymoseptoria tritici ST99CH_3D1]